MKKAGRGASPPMKKAKKSDPVKENQDIVMKYLKDTESCDVQGPDTCRDMLIQALPHALGLGAASDERCPFQTNLGSFIGEVISASAAKWQGQVSAAQAKVDECEAEKAVADHAKAEASAQVEKQKKVVEDTTAGLKESKETEKEAIKAAAAADKEVAEFDDEQAAKVDEKAESQSIFDDCFTVLKAGDYTGKFPSSKLAKITSLLESLKTDGSMLSALPLALKKKVDERGKFDEMVVSQSEAVLLENLKTLDERISSGDSLKKAKEAAAEAAKAAVESAKEKKEASIEALKFAQDVLKGAEITAKDAQKTVSQKASAVSKAKAEHAVEESGLEKAQKVVEAFGFLKDRVAAVKEDEEEGGPEPPASPSRLGSLVSTVSGLIFSPTKPEPTEEAEA